MSDPRPISGPRPKWTLDQQAFHALLQAAGSPEHYEELRLRLIRYFRWEHCDDPETCADETFNRIAKRLQQGEQIASLDAYLHAVARFIVKEDKTRRELRARALTELPISTTTPDPAPELHCLQQCLSALPPDQQDFILRYYQGRQSAKIQNRQAMASEFGIQLNALRNRALRLRDRLEACVKACVNRSS